MNQNQMMLRQRILGLPSAMRTKLFIEDDTDGTVCALYADADGGIFVVPDEPYYKETQGIVRLLPHVVVPFCYAYNLGEYDSVDEYETAILSAVLDEHIDAIEKAYTANLKKPVRTGGDLNPNPLFGF